MNTNVEKIYILKNIGDNSEIPESLIDISIIEKVDPALLDIRLAPKQIYRKLNIVDVAEICTHLLVYKNILYHKHKTSLILDLHADISSIEDTIDFCTIEDSFKDSNIFYISETANNYFIDLRSAQKLINLEKIHFELKTTFLSAKLVINKTSKPIQLKSYTPDIPVWDIIFQ